jgi:hypothetical protein
MDLMPLLKNDTQQVDRVLHWLSGDSWAVRKGAWKLIGQGESERVLVNLEKDMAEKINQLQDQPALVQELRELHREWIKAVGTR